MAERLEFEVKLNAEKAGEDMANQIRKKLESTLSKLGLGDIAVGVKAATGKEGGGMGGAAMGAIMGGVAGGIMMLVDALKDMPLITAIMKMLKLLMQILLFPLVPILKPVLILLAWVIKLLAPLFKLLMKDPSKKPMEEQIKLAKEAIAKRGFWGELWYELKTIGKALWAAITRSWAFLVENLGKIFGYLWENWVVPFVGLLGTVFGYVWENWVVPFVGLLGSIFGYIWENGIVPLGQMIAQAAVNIWETIIKPGWEFLRDIGKQIWESYIKPAWEFLEDVGMWIWNILKPPFESVVNAFEWVINAFSGVVDAVQGLVERIRNLVSSGMSTISSAASKGAAEVKGVAMWAINIIKTMIARLSRSSGGGAGDFISRPGMPLQTFSPSDTVIGVKDVSKLGGKGGTTIIINNPSVRKDDDIKILVREIEKRLGTDMRGRVSYA